jgi:hypothetical protein
MLFSAAFISIIALSFILFFMIEEDDDVLHAITLLTNSQIDDHMIILDIFAFFRNLNFIN